MIRSGFRLPWKSGKAPLASQPLLFPPPSLPFSSACLGFRSFFSPLQGSDRTSSRSFLPRFLREDFRSSQTPRWLETGSRPFFSEPLSDQLFFPTRIPDFSQGFHPPERLGHIYRPHGCLLPHPHSQSRQEVSSLCVAGSSFPIHLPSVWPSSSPLAFYETHERALCSRAQCSDSPARLSGRLANSSFFSVPVQVSHDLHAESLHRPRFPSQPEEIRFGTQTTVSISGDVFRHCHVEGLPFPRQNLSSPDFSSQARISGPSPCSPNCSPLGLHGVSCSPSSPRSSSQTPVPEDLQVSLVSERTVLGSSCPSGPPVLSSCSPVEEPDMALLGGPHHKPSSGPSTLHGRLLQGLGGSHGLSVDFRQLGAELHFGSHQPLRARSSLSSPKSLPTGCQKEACPSQLRQHHSVLLHKQTRGGEVIHSVPQDGESAPLVSRSQHSSFGQVCPGPSQRSSGCIEPVPHDPSFGVDPCPLSPPACLADMAQTSRGSVCDKVLTSPADLRVSGSRPGSPGSGCSVNALEGHPRLRLSTVGSLGKSCKESKRRRSRHHSDRSSLEGTAMVSRPSSSHSCSSHQAKSHGKDANTTKVRHSSRQPSFAGSSRMASVRESLSSRGASQEVLELVEHAHRSGTQGAYHSHWNSWVSWCSENNIRPASPSRFQFSNYLAFLFRNRKLSASSIKAHRAAISTTIRQLGGRSFSDDPLLRDVTRGVALEEARSPRLFPEWDLFFVLSSLKEAPYEPLKFCSLKHLTEKTVFLISLASGRRCSEINALSGSKLATERDGSITLKFVSGFLAKNQPPGFQASPINIKNLVDRVCRDDSDHLLCPVRALREYRARTKSKRTPNNRLLFLSYKPGFTKDISRASVSRWIRNVIKTAYVSDTSVPRPVSFRAHEVRAWASSLAFCP